MAAWWGVWDYAAAGCCFEEKTTRVHCFLLSARTHCTCTDDVMNNPKAATTFYIRLMQGSHLTGPHYIPNLQTFV